jgi:hypothetical protein
VTFIVGSPIKHFIPLHVIHLVSLMILISLTTWHHSCSERIEVKRGEESQTPSHQPIRLPGLKPRVCPGLILSGAFRPQSRNRGFGAVERINGARCDGDIRAAKYEVDGGARKFSRNCDRLRTNHGE